MIIFGKKLDKCFIHSVGELNVFFYDVLKKDERKDTFKLKSFAVQDEESLQSLLLYLVLFSMNPLITQGFFSLRASSSGRDFHSHYNVLYLNKAP